VSGAPLEFRTLRPIRRRAAWPLIAGVLALGLMLAPAPLSAHPLGNFSINQYTAIHVGAERVELRYLIDFAEIPTFQELQDAGLVPEPEDPGVRRYLARKVEALAEGLVLRVDDRRLRLDVASSDVIFPPGIGGLPTMKVGAVYRARLPEAPTELGRLQYRDDNFPGRAGWKEIIGVAGDGVRLTSASVPEADRSRALADYPTDLLNSPPQVLEARIEFVRVPGGPAVAAVQPAAPPPAANPRRAPPAPAAEAPAAPAAPRPASSPAGSPAVEPAPATPAPVGPTPTAEPPPLRLEPNRQATPRSALADLATTRELSLGVIALAMLVAAGLGAVHALEPGHGKTVVAAYLVGSRGTAWHAMWLGLIVTASHTAGVYLLGAVTLYATQYVVPERLYPWLGVLSGLAIAGLGLTLLIRRAARGAAPHRHGHAHGHAHDHHHHGDDPGPGHDHGPLHGHDHGGAQDHHHDAPHSHGHPHAHDAVSVSALVTLGVTGGIIPCPAALVVLLSAVSLNRVGFGLLLIVAFSVGLAAVLIAIGILMVYARRFMARFQGEGPLIQRWLPLTSSALIVILGVGIAVQALVTAGILVIRL
jgi:ABC-type nickel/cobalt efflux system permease component RcnA